MAQKGRPPAAMVAPLLAWYAQNRRVLPWRENRDPYRVWISEIMLQQTRVDTVIPYYNRFLAAFPTVHALAQADEEELLKLWEGLGYYSRARNLKRAAQMIENEFDGRFPQTPQLVAKLPGIGPYTVGAICSIAFELPTPAVDGNVLRVLSRVCACTENIDDNACKRRWTEALAAVYPQTGRGDFTQSLMELGALVCLPNGAPLCDRCPLAQLCKAHLAKTEEQYPVRAQKPARTVQKMTVFRLIYDGKLALCRRPQSGLLAGLWQLPNTAGKLTEAQAKAWLKQNGIVAEKIEKPTRHTHIFTHIEWHMTGYTVMCASAPDGYTFASPAQLEEEYPLPTAFRKLL